ncbi:MAG: hypothetical protein L0Y57_07995 [Beijerinckiaceae bacterium]|nr:hypothetical protein [Beijerinckiaceae bacterium]
MLIIEERHCEGIFVTRPARPKNVPVMPAGANKFDCPGEEHDPGGPESASGSVGGRCAKKSASKPEIADQIGLQLRSIYDDVLAQPVPGRFLDLLQQLEAASKPGFSKDRM